MEQLILALLIPRNGRDSLRLLMVLIKIIYIVIRASPQISIACAMHVLRADSLAWKFQLPAIC